MDPEEIAHASIRVLDAIRPHVVEAMRAEGFEQYAVMICKIIPYRDMYWTGVGEISSSTEEARSIPRTVAIKTAIVALKEAASGDKVWMERGWQSGES